MKANDAMNNNYKRLTIVNIFKKHTIDNKIRSPKRLLIFFSSFLQTTTTEHMLCRFFCAYGAGLYHSAGSIVKGCERGLCALAHGNYNLLIGHR